MIAPAKLRPVEIVGGGLAGLGLALGLRRVDVPVILREAESYPRHRVCGEFITSLDQPTIDALGLTPLLQDALSARSVTWFRGETHQLSQMLPEPARCLSRYNLDRRMAEAFADSGGELITGTKSDLSPAEGRVLAAGRRPTAQSPWLGIKAHFTGLDLQDDLELHLGSHAYVGLTQVENGRVNVCGLFRRIASGSHRTSKESVLFDHLSSSGLAQLAERLGSATVDQASLRTVAGLAYASTPPESGALRLGDQFGLIPPFTGNGMTVALQSARIAIEPLRRWSQGQINWAQAIQQTQAGLLRELSPKITRAQWLHPWLLKPRRQQWLVRIARSRLLPTRILYQLLH